MSGDFMVTDMRHIFLERLCFFARRQARSLLFFVLLALIIHSLIHSLTHSPSYYLPAFTYMYLFAQLLGSEIGLIVAVRVWQ
jgi:hypothetical protein